MVTRERDSRQESGGSDDIGEQGWGLLGEEQGGPREPQRPSGATEDSRARAEQVQEENSGGHTRNDTVPAGSRGFGNQPSWFAREGGSAWNVGSSVLKGGRSQDKSAILTQRKDGFLELGDAVTLPASQNRLTLLACSHASPPPPRALSAQFH